MQAAQINRYVLRSDKIPHQNYLQKMNRNVNKVSPSEQSVNSRKYAMELLSSPQPYLFKCVQTIQSISFIFDVVATDKIKCM